MTPHRSKEDSPNAEPFVLKSGADVAQNNRQFRLGIRKAPPWCRNVEEKSSTSIKRACRILRKVSPAVAQNCYKDSYAAVTPHRSKVERIAEKNIQNFHSEGDEAAVNENRRKINENDFSTMNDAEGLNDNKPQASSKRKSEEHNIFFGSNQEDKNLIFPKDTGKKT